eukprot:1266385-Prymnesium_polylepis.1
MNALQDSHRARGSASTNAESRGPAPPRHYRAACMRRRDETGDARGEGRKCSTYRTPTLLALIMITRWSLARLEASCRVPSGQSSCRAERLCVRTFLIPANN